MKWDFRYPAFLRSFKRRSASWVPKDIGMAIALLGIGKDSIVGEIGVGNGFVTAYLARIAKRVYAYELRKEHWEVARKNLKGFDNVELKLEDGRNFSEEVDALIVDVPQPWELLHVLEKVRGRSIFFLPNITQVVELSAKLRERGMDPYVVRLIQEEWSVKEKVAKPHHVQLYHTAWLVMVEGKE